MTEIMTSQSFFFFNFADIKFAVMLIKITFKVACVVKMKLFFMD